jgi:hypothetical protein
VELRRISKEIVEKLVEIEAAAELGVEHRGAIEKTKR